MKVHIVSLYTLVYLILGCKYKISFCNASDSDDDVTIEDRSEVDSEDEHITLNLDIKKTTDKFEYKKNGAEGNLFTAKDDYRFNKVTSGGQLVWEATKKEYPDRVYYEPRDGKPLLKLIYSDEEFTLPKVPKAAARVAKAAPAHHVKKTAAGQTYAEFKMPKTDNEGEVSVKVSKAAAMKPKIAPSKTAIPVAASHQVVAGQAYAEFKMPKTDNEGEGESRDYLDRKLPPTEDEGPIPPKSAKLRVSAAPASRHLAVERGDNYVQMPLPKSGDEGESKVEDVCAPCSERGAGYVQMPLPKTDNEGDDLPAHAGPKKHVVKVETVHTNVKTAKAPSAARVVATPSPVRAGVEDGQSYLEFGIPPTDNEGSGAVAGQDYLEFKLVDTEPEHGKGAPSAPGALPKRKAIVGAKYQDHAMPQTTEAESEEFDFDTDPDIQFLLKFIEDMKQKLAVLRKTIAEMDANDALRAQAAGL